jgi:N-acetylmuramoyl-L-alanine amidase
MQVKARLDDQRFALMRNVNGPSVLIEIGYKPDIARLTHNFTDIAGLEQLAARMTSVQMAGVDNSSAPSG